MINVMIVEDEMIVRVGMRILLDWEKYGFRYVAEATDGMEALEILKKQHIDIVITDVKMPIMDGLKMIEEIKRLNIKCEIVIMSGYDDFEYVKKAMIYGVKDYIHKPTMKPEDIINTLLRISDDIENIRHFDNYKKIIMDTYSETRSFLLEKAIRNLIDGGANDFYDEIMNCGNLKGSQIHLSIMTNLLKEDFMQPDRLISFFRSFVIDQENLGIYELNIICCFRKEHYLVVAIQGMNPTSFIEDFANRYCSASGIELLWKISDPILMEDVKNTYFYLTELMVEMTESVNANQIVADALQYIDNNFTHRITLNSIANEIHTSPSYLSRLFSKTTGQSFTECLTGKRIAYAKELLKATNLSIDDIAERIGYQNGKYFIKVFKKNEKISPGKYKNSNKKTAK